MIDEKTDVNDPEFNAWCDKIDVYGRERGCNFAYTYHTGRESWLDMFERGFSPTDALDEEFSAAASDIE